MESTKAPLRQRSLCEIRGPGMVSLARCNHQTAIVAAELNHTDTPANPAWRTARTNPAGNRLRSHHGLHFCLLAAQVPTSRLPDPYSPCVKLVLDFRGCLPLERNHILPLQIAPVLKRPTGRSQTLRLVQICLSLGLAMTAQNPTPAADPPRQDYLVYVVCESADKIVLLRFGPKGLQVENQTRTGLMPMDINGPHGIAVSPDKKYFYVSEG